MINIFGRLKFVHHDEVFNTREDAYAYVLGLDKVDRPSVVGEPMVLLYKSDDNEQGPNVILAIGSVGNGTASMDNRTFFIDTKKTEDEIGEMGQLIEDAIESLTVMPIETDTIKMSAEKTDEGTTIKGDVKIPAYKIHDMEIHNNIIESDSDGIYAFVDMAYDPETSIITFKVNGVSKEINLPSDQHVVSGRYDTETESIILTLADRSEVSILVTKLIEEWTVLPDGQSLVGHDVSGQTVYYSPIVMYKTHVRSEATEHEGIFDWQDVLEADIRVADHIPNNIIHKDATGRYLYVKGTADNIRYKNGKTVEEALDDLDINISTSNGNLIYKRQDGIYAAAMLDYKTAENKLVYKYSDGANGEMKQVEFELNSIQLLNDISYDSANEAIIIRYTDSTGNLKRLVIPVKDIIEEWVVNNEGHNIKLDRFRSEGAGADVLSADAKIFDDEFNILEDRNHSLFVNGVASNIIYDVDNRTTVKDKLGEALENDVILNERMNTLSNMIGSGFTADPHENVTFKFEEMSDELSSIEGTIGNIDEIVEKVESAMTHIDEVVETLNEEVDVVVNGIEELSGKTDTMSGVVDTLSGDVATVVSDVASLKGNVETLSGNVTTLSDAVDLLGEKTDDLSAKTITEIASSNESIDIEKTRADDGTSIVDLVTDSSKIKIIGFTPDLSGFTAITSSSTITDAIKVTEDVIIEDERIISESLNDLNSRIIELSGNTGDIGDELSELTESVTEVVGDVDALSDTVNLLSSKTDGLSAKTITEITSSNGSISAITSSASDATISVDVTTDSSKIKMAGFIPDLSGFTEITDETTITEAIKIIEDSIIEDENVIADALNDLNYRLISSNNLLLQTIQEVSEISIDEGVYEGDDVEDDYNNAYNN